MEEIISLEIKGQFTSQEELEKYLNAVLEAVKMSNKLNMPFHAFDGTDGKGNAISATAKKG